MSTKKSVVVNFGSPVHPSGGLRFGSQPREDEAEQHQDKAQGNESEVEAAPAAG